MKRSIILFLIIGLIAVSITSAEAGKKTKKPKRIERVAEAAYDAPALGAASSGGVCPHATNSCAAIATGKNDRYVKIEVLDATGTPVAFTLGQDTDPETLGTETTYGLFCGSTGEDAIRIEGVGVELLSFVWAFGDIQCPGGVATTGTVVATFSNIP